MKDLTGKKLLILAGADVHNKIVLAARAMGVYTIVTDYLPINESPAKRLADEYWMIDIMDVDSIVERCCKEKVDGVLAYCIDPAQIPYQQICEKLNVPCYGTKQQFEIMTNKRLFKELCKQHNVDVVPEYSIEDINNGNVKYPILIKPNISRGSRGQTVCFCKEDVSNAVKIASNESRDNNILIERYMSDCQDISLSYIVIGGEPYLVKLGDRYLGSINDNLDRQQMCTILPSKYVSEITRYVDPKIKKMIKAVGVKFGAIFLQGFYEDGHVYMYDPGLRFPGSDFDIVTKYATGFDAMSSFIYFSLTGDIKSCFGNPIGVYNQNGGACVILSLSVRPGLISAFEGFEDIANLSYVFSSTKRRHVGANVEATGDIQQRAAEFCAFIKDRKDVPLFIKHVYDTVKIIDEKGTDMIISKIMI